MSVKVHKSGSFMSLFLKGEAVSAFWNFTTKGIGLLNTFLTITSLTLYQYGVFQLILSFSGIPSDFLNLGSAVISNEISRAIADNRIADAKRIFIEYSIIRFILSVLVWIIVFFGATYFFQKYNIDFIKDMRLISVLILTEGIFSIIRSLCLIRLQFGIVALRYTINKAVQFVILVFFFLQGNLGLKQLIWSIIIASTLSVLAVSFKFLRVYLKWSDVKPSQKVLVWNIFLTYGTWDIVRQFANKVTFRIKPWLIKHFISTEAVAIFSIAETIVTTLQDILPSNTLQSLIPLWIKDKALSVKMFSYGVKYFVLIGIATALVGATIVPLVVHLLFAKYSASIPLFFLMIINLPIFAAGILIGNYLIAHRKQKYIFFLHLFRNILTLSIIILTLPLIGLWGLAIEFVLVPLILVIMTYLYTKNQEQGFHFDFKIIFGFNNEDKDILRRGMGIIRGWLAKLIPLSQ